MTWPMHRAVWPVSFHLRPRPRCELVAEADVDPQILRLYPNVVDELNSCPAYGWRGHGRPGRGWDDWEHERVELVQAISLPAGGEA